jgi:hypothetical protein
MSNIPIFPGSSSFSTGSTPFGFYDNDPIFRADADKFSLFAARRLGYPIVDVELQDLNFYAAFEEAVTVYGNEIYAYKIRQDFLSLEGLNIPNSVPNINGNPSLAFSNINQNLGNIIKISEQYGTEAGTGGNTSWHTGSIPLTASVQDYDLNAWAVSKGYQDKDIEIKRVFYESPPAITRFFDPYVGSGAGIMNVMDSFGWGNYSPGSISNVSNVPFTNPVYSQINSIGRSWIFEYALAISKEMLGYIRGKFSQIPIPGDTVTLNQGDLLTSATADKQALLEKLKLYLEETSRDKLLETRSRETEYRQKELSQIPFPIYIG